MYAETVASAEGAIVLPLEADLQATRDRLQSTTEQLESSNEQLRSDNEKLSSVKEELQSANEEWEASREELRSDLRGPRDISIPYRSFDHKRELPFWEQPLQRAVGASHGLQSQPLWECRSARRPKQVITCYCTFGVR